MRSKGMGLADEFKQFLMRGNLVEMAVAIVIGIAFANVVTAFVEDMITPLIAAIGGKQDFASLTFTINDSVFRYHQQADLVRHDRLRDLLPGDQAGERTHCPHAQGAAAGPDRAQVPRVPQRHLPRSTPLCLLHV